jgi:hypothetical protein
MKNISIQYQDLQEGKMNRHQFLRNARMMFPNHVTQFNSFEDSVKILKSKGLLNEGDAVQGTPDKAPTYKYPNEATKYKKVEQSPEVDEQDGIYPATTLTDIPKEKMDKKVKDTSDGLEPIKDKDTKNEMKKVKVVKENVNEEYDGGPDDLAAMAREEDNTAVLTSDKVVQLAAKAGQIIQDAEADLNDLAASYGNKVPKKRVIDILANYDITFADLRKVKAPKNKFLSMDDLMNRGLLEGTLKEAVKEMVRKALAEYEIGDEEDVAPNDAMAVGRIVDAFIEHTDEINIRKDLSTKADVERAFTKFENEVGKRYSDDVFDNVMDALKNKGYKIK